MFLSLWNYIRGYVTIEVTGFSVERFVNLAVYKGIYLWDMVYTGSAVRMKVSVKGFKLLKSCAKKTKCHIKIEDKNGYPFLAHRYRKRKILAGGLVFFIGILYFLSSFVWLVEIEGNERLKKDELISFCEEQGLKVGVIKYRIDEKELKSKFLNKYSEISWINIHIKGTKATVSLRETLPKQSIISYDAPCHIVAKKDGLITSIATSAGTPLIRQKDVVKQGEVLVSGELNSINEYGEIVSKDYVHAVAEVRAKMYYQINFKVPMVCMKKNYTTKIQKDHSITILDKNINLIKSRISYTNYDKIISRKQLSLGENYPLPIVILTAEYREFIPEDVVRTVEGAKELADRMVTGRIIREFDFEADVVDRVMVVTETPEALDVKALVTTIERIDMESEIVEGNETTKENEIEPSKNQRGM